MLEKFDIFTIEDKDFIVLDTLSKNGKTYYMLNEIDKEEELLDNVQIMFEEKDTDGEMGLAFEDDKAVLKDLSIDFAARLKKEYE